LANIKEVRSLIFYFEMKMEWGKEKHTVCCKRNKRRFKTGIWRQRDEERI
jgi:hypothetical protein